jgi:hypothetical protein
MLHAELWKTESDSSQQLLFSLLGIAVGLVLSIGFRHFDGSGFTNSLAGFLLGLFVLVISAGMLLTGGKQIITVNSKTRRIELEDISRFSNKKRSLRFDEIESFYVDELGDKEGGSIQYFVVARLKTGKKVSLFLGFFDGRYDKYAMEARCRRLTDYLHP